MKKFFGVIKVKFNFLSFNLTFKVYSSEHVNLNPVALEIKINFYLLSFFY